MDADRNSNHPPFKICQAPYEDIKHILTEYKGMKEARQRIFPDLVNLVAMTNLSNELLSLNTVTLPSSYLTVGPSTLTTATDYLLSPRNIRHL